MTDSKCSTSTLALTTDPPPDSKTSIGPNTDLRLSNNLINPDGFPRVAVLAEGVFPGPAITGKKGDQFNIYVKNNLADRTMETFATIHWHGLHVRRYVWADGVPNVTQCPIPPGGALKYTFNGGDQAGTFWYHSHITTQYCDGLRGPLIIYDPNDPRDQTLYDVDDENTIITLADWYHNPFNGNLESNSTLINGLGRYKGGPKVPLAVVSVEHKKRYRFRFISTSCDPSFNVSIDGHKFTIIEADGVDTEPVTVQSFQIFAGQRYSAVLKADNEIGNYWIRVNPSIGNPGFDGGINSAILRYRGAPNEEPKTLEEEPKMLKEWDLHPLEKNTIRIPDEKIDLVMMTENGTRAFLMNNVTYIPPNITVLSQILNGAPNPEALLPSGSIYPVPWNKTVQLSMPILHGLTGNPHAMHLHGQKFTVIRSAGNDSIQWDNPIQRDVVDTGNLGDNVTIQWRTDNPGPWIFHCHIEDHLLRGMAIIFVPKNLTKVISDNNPPPLDWKMLPCPEHEEVFT
ncbi:laccase [Marasmius fiardii PR-910]|nr:laccase [Marasmius fiardii PR-910]